MSAADNRKTVRLKRPNPLFETWLNEWKQQAEVINSDAKFKFEKALESLRKYPLVLSSGKECLILEHFDAALCIKLDRRLAEYKKSDGKDSISAFTSDSAGQNTENMDKPGSTTNNPTQKPRKRKKSISALSEKEPIESSSPKPKKKPYLPKNRTGPFAILVTLFKNEEANGSKDWMSKAELQKAGQPLCDMSFTRPQQGSFYTAWSSMSQLVTKGYVKKQSHPPKFSLTGDGRELSLKLMSMYPDEVADFQVQCTDPSYLLTSTADILAPGKKNQPKPSPVKKGRKKNADVASQENLSSQQSEEPIESGPEYFIPNSFDVILLVDTAETIGAQKKAEDETVRELTKLLVKFEVRRLNVGDFLWIARHRESGKELALPYIVERKRLDDLAGSIKDGRFREQKFRLKNCGLPNLIYLVELMRGDHVGLPIETLKYSIARTQVCDNFSVEIKKNHKDSMLYLGQLTTVLSKLFEVKTLFCCKKEDIPESLDIQDDIISLCTFQNFNYNIGKLRNFSVKEMLQKQLLQLYGVSSEMAWAIVQLYPTPLTLHKAFFTQGEGLLENIQYGPLKRRIGPAISKTLHRFYTLSQFIS